MSAADETTFAIALDGAVVCAVWRDSSGHGTWRFTESPCDATPESFGAALHTIAAMLPPMHSISVALLRPVAQTRTVHLPSMARAALQRVLARDWARYLIGIRATPHTVVAEQVGRASWRASFAPTDVLDALSDASREQGWEIDVRTGDDALEGAAHFLVPDATRGNCVVVVCDADGPTHAVSLQDGKVRIGRHFLAGANAADIMAFDRTPGTPIIVLGGGTRGVSLARELGQQGHRARAVDTGLPPDAPAQAVVALATTLVPAALPLRSVRELAAHQRRTRTLTRWLALAAATAVLVGFALERHRVDVQLATVQRERADVAASVSNAVAKRTELENALDAASALSDREAAASRASGVISAITVALPAGVSLTTLQVAGDSVSVEGESGKSAQVYEALRKLTVLDEVKLAAPLRQDRLTGDVPVEHFAFSARVHRASSGMHTAGR
ncbi:MAG TPA: PilN domain-containing protein [Gemmatimonadaceae bacterium]